MERARIEAILDQIDMHRHGGNKATAAQLFATLLEQLGAEGRKQYRDLYGQHFEVLEAELPASPLLTSRPGRTTAPTSPPEGG